MSHPAASFAAQIPRNDRSKLSKQQVEAVTALKTYLKNHFHFDDGMFVDFLGKEVDEHGAEEDHAALGAGLMEYYRTRAERQKFKLTFRNGLAHKWVKERFLRHLRIYDTDDDGDVVEKRMSLYVMDSHGRIYVGGIERNGVAFKHSSFLGGEPTAAAGTIRVERGQIVWVTGRSGHYRPSVRQMVNLLEQLQAYSVDLSRVTVMRENYTGAFAHADPKFFEPLPALTLMQRRSWPGPHPDLMRVG